MQDIEVPGALVGVEAAVDRALREAGGGRLAGVRVEREFGRVCYLVQFVRGTWLCTATVDARTGEVTTILDDGAGITVTPDDRAGPGRRSTLRLPFRTVWDVCPAVDDPEACYVATDAGIAVVLLRPAAARVLIRESQNAAPGAVRQLASVPGGVIGVTAGGQVFRMDRAGRCRWETRLPASLYTVAADDTGSRVLIATNAGAIELGADRGDFLGTVGDETTAGEGVPVGDWMTAGVGMPTEDGVPAGVGMAAGGGMAVRAAGYLPGGGRVLAGHCGDVLVVGPDGGVRSRWRQGEYPERLWVRGERVYLAGEGGLKEIVPGEGVVCRWSDPSVETVESAVVAAGRVFTCAPGSHVSRHGYATAAFHGRVPSVPADPAVITALGGEEPWLLIGHHGGLISAHAID